MDEPLHARERQWPVGFEIKVNSLRPVMRVVIWIAGIEERMLEDDAEKLDQVAKRLTKSAVQLVVDDSDSSSYFGNAPKARFRWPHNEERPLVHLACIDLAAVPTEGKLSFLPDTGRLLFFCDLYEPTWGYDPKHKRGWHVEYVPESEIEDGDAEIPESIEFEGIETRRGLSFRCLQLPPSWTCEDIQSLDVGREALEQYMAYRQSLFANRPAHQLGGYADPVQGGDMQLQCQLVTNGLYCGNEKGYKDPMAKQLATGASDWELLLQVDSDDDLDLMWGDCGKAYYWVRRQDAEHLKFDASWTILQCY